MEATSTVAEEHTLVTSFSATPGEAMAADTTSAAPRAGADPVDVSAQGRRRIEEQIQALKRREAELRRELAMADHPEMAEAIRVIEGKVFALTRADERLAAGLSKGEERRLAALEKKLTSAREKRAELDAQIAELEAEAATLGEERRGAFSAARREALEELLAVLGRHEPELRKVSLSATALVPEVERWLPEVEALAKEISAAGAASQAPVP